MRGYSISTFKGDLFGGLTAGIIALPLALAFGVSCGAGAAAGLYGAIALGLVASLLGGTPTQVSGPTGPMTVVTASAIAAFPGDFQTIITIVCLAGLLQIVFGALRMGVFVKFIPYPVISGFMSGIGIIIILLQIHPLLGCASVSSPLQSVLTLGSAITSINPDSLIIASITMGIVFFTPARMSRVLPSPLIALLVCSTLSVALGLKVETIGEISASLPDLQMPSIDLARLPQIAGLALALAMLGTIDTLLTSVVADSMTGDRHNPNKELMGQGLGNLLSGIVGGLAGAGATMRTVVNIKAGGTTRVSGLVHSLFLLAVLLGLGRYTAHIPMPVLAGILVKVGVDILDYRLLRLIRTAPRHDLVVMLTVFCITVFFDLIIAVAAGVALSCILLVYRIAKQAQVSIMGNEAQSSSLQHDEFTNLPHVVRVLTVSGPFFFGTTALMQDKIDSLLGTKAVIIDCMDVPFMDISAKFALADLVAKLCDASVQPIVCVRRELAEELYQIGFKTCIGTQDVTFSRADAVKRLEQFIPKNEILLQQEPALQS